MTASFSSRSFRDVLGCFATGIAVVTTCDAQNTPFGVTINSFASVSLDPPLVLFSLDQRSNSLAAFQHAAGFSINILAEHQQALSNRFAGPESARWEGQPWQPAPITGMPLLPDCLARFTCLSYAQHDGGDHVILIGRTVWLEQPNPGKPLLYVRGGYATVA